MDEYVILDHHCSDSDEMHRMVTEFQGSLYRHKFVYGMFSTMKKMIKLSNEDVAMFKLKYGNIKLRKRKDYEKFLNKQPPGYLFYHPNGE